ncbi:bifunctional DNA primase/polymerase [Methylobacterium iners]|uniref:DNA primase/polymerase bifunctional N-terminal domain-containing protein n=1 Tax=Methylobacterium iners TaxID=418707 RepID=A0ABQ4S3J5_9HYPH|nr:bifunctional DNA primase/polymerase [Methylobacterium iners]GJD97700.1 hypothetical protein OCOJLMKI_4933 [Methylobacterium iners]
MSDLTFRRTPVETDYCALHLANVVANGFHAFFIPLATKAASLKGWQRWNRTPPRSDQVARWIERHGHCGLAIASGFSCLAVDNDEDDPARAAEVNALIVASLGPTPLVRVGRAPRCIHVYRVLGPPIASRRLGPKVELIADKRYFVSHNLHPGTGLPYTWPDRAPENCPLLEVPGVDAAAINAFAVLIAGYYGVPAKLIETVRTSPIDTASAVPGAYDTRATHSRGPAATRAAWVRPDPRWVIDAQGRVIDGRETFLACAIYAAFRAGHTSAEAIADAAWTRFAQAADLTRPARDGRKPWTYADSLAKARALVAKGGPRAARRITTVADNFWTPQVLAAFRRVVDARGARGLLSPSAVSVSHAMADHARGSGVCFASPATLAARLGLSVGTVKAARRSLVKASLWRVANNKGGRARGADYSPDPVALHAGDDPSPADCANPDGGNGDRSAHTKCRVGSDATLQEKARDGTCPRRASKEFPGSPLVFSGLPAPSQRYRENRRAGVASRVADVPEEASAPSDTGEEGGA